ncbi:MAG: 6-oxopurine nucleoside phosphorylase [Candidatus Altiarchaeales archaeon]|nr:6-oxopurine nucleoside phosphorylase [Candidatus Altiarchaeales archaeon]MBD3416279.1 6-oxopurine nucleoside phosphorylase [Candidatus Altiarchaeales archaeon]
MIGLIGGTLLPETRLLGECEERSVDTPYGGVDLLAGPDAAFINRHRGDVPPHRVNHRANIWALKSLTDTVIGVGSAGSLKAGLTPPVIIVPSDYIELEPVTFYDEEIKHVTPGFDEDLRNSILRVAGENGIKVQGGVYYQTRGPRLETKAEIRMMADYADIVGMTIGSEATLAREAGLKYAAICCADNFAHGIADEKLDFEAVKEISRKNSILVEELLAEVLEELR